MNKELIDKCLDFAEGKKGKFTILMSKKSNFPDTLLEGTERQQLIDGYVKAGLSTKEIAEAMECSTANITEQIRKHKKSISFYGEWREFWEFAAAVRKAPIADAFSDILPEYEIADYEYKDILTVGDFLQFSVSMSTTSMYKALIGLDAEKKGKLFEHIREMCYQLLTVRNE